MAFSFTSLQAGYTRIAFGLTSDKPVSADYNGDGKTDLLRLRNGKGCASSTQINNQQIRKELAFTNSLPFTKGKRERVQFEKVLVKERVICSLDSRPITSRRINLKGNKSGSFFYM